MANNGISGVTVVIVTYNSSSEIVQCLKSLYNNNDVKDCLEVIVVDNNSNDFEITQSYIKADFPQVKILRNQSNGGYGQGNNMGIKEAKHPVILIMNPDVRLFKPIFRAGMNEFARDSNLALLGMQQYNEPGKKGASFLVKEPTLLNLILHKLCLPLCIYLPRVFFISGACFFIRKTDFERIGCFDENIFLYGEETDINERLLADNKKISFDRKLGYIHPMEGRGDALITLQRGLSSALYICKKNNKSTKRLKRIYYNYYKMLLARSEKTGDKEQATVYKEFLLSLEENIQ